MRTESALATTYNTLYSKSDFCIQIGLFGNRILSARPDRSPKPPRQTSSITRSICIGIWSRLDHLKAGGIGFQMVQTRSKSDTYRQSYGRSLASRFGRSIRPGGQDLISEKSDLDTKVRLGIQFVNVQFFEHSMYHPPKQKQNYPPSAMCGIDVSQWAASIPKQSKNKRFFWSVTVFFFAKKCFKKTLSGGMSE